MYVRPLWGRAPTPWCSAARPPVLPESKAWSQTWPRPSVHDAHVAQSPQPAAGEPPAKPQDKQAGRGLHSRKAGVGVRKRAGQLQSPLRTGWRSLRPQEAQSATPCQADTWRLQQEPLQKWGQLSDATPPYYWPQNLRPTRPSLQGRPGSLQQVVPPQGAGLQADMTETRHRPHTSKSGESRNRGPPPARCFLACHPASSSSPPC